MPDVHQRIFNHDLLTNSGDVDLAKESFPNVIEALDRPQLQEAFIPHERAANRAKAESRKRGVLALTAVLVELWLAALEPRLPDLLPGVALLWVLTSAIALLGAFGAVLGSRVLIGARKESWLHHRTAAERLCLLRFQVLVRRASQLAATDTALVEGVIEERERLLDLFKHDFKPGVARPVEAIVRDLGGAECGLIGERSPIPPTELRTAIQDELFRAYAKLRFDHQAEHAGKKLAEGVGLWPWEPEGQARQIGETSYGLTLIVILCHVLAVVVITLGLIGENWISPSMQTVAMLAALGVLALRVLEGGLRPRAEAARLRTYEGEVEELRRKFTTTIEPLSTLALMERLEEVSYRELRDFLTLHDEASFVL